MLEYHQISELQKITNKLLTDDKPEHIYDKKSEYDLSWNFSLFISKILINSKQKLPLNKANFISELNDYNKRFNKNIVLENIESKYWIRNIFGEIKIPSMVFSFCRKLYDDIEEQKNYKNNPNYEELLFLGYIANKYGYEDSRPFIIEKTFFIDLYNNFKQIYPKIIDYSELVQLLKFEETDDKIYYSYLPFNIRQNVSNDKVSYYVWEEFSSNTNDFEDAIKKWAVLLEEFWTTNFINFLPPAQKETFAENAINILINEKDLIFDVKNEYNKIICDLHHFYNSDYNIFLQTNKKKFEINCTDYFTLYTTRDSRFDLHDILISQNSKELYLNLLSPILVTKNPVFIKKILTDKNKYPYLFSHILFSLKNNNPELLLNFINEEDYGLVFYISFIELCFEKICFPQNEIITETIISLIKKVIYLFVEENFKIFPFRYKQFSRILMWLEIFYSKVDQRQKIYKIKRDIYNYHKNLLKKSFSHQKQKNDFIQLLDSFREEKDFTLTSYNDFQFPQLSFLFSILDIANEQHNDDAINIIIDEIISSYTKNVLSKKKLFISYEFSLIEDLNWTLFYKILHITNRSNNFLSQVLNSFIIPATIPDTNNFEITQSNINKYKLLLKTLCLAYNSFSGEIKEFYENLILNFLPYCFKDDYSNRCINIFSSIYESSINENINTAIFPLVVKTGNNFSQDGKEIFIKIILENGNFRLLFKAYNLLNFSDGQKQIETFIKDTDFSSKIDEIYTIPDFIEIVTNVANSRINEKFENLLFEELNNIINIKAKEGYISEYTYQAELLKLFHYYKLKKIEDLESYTFPFNEFSQKYAEYKQLLDTNKLFYKALLDLDKEKYQDAFNVLELISKKYPSNNQYQVYKLYAKSLLLEGKNNFESRISLLKDIESLDKKEIQNRELLLFTKLRLYLLNEDYDLALYFYHSIDDDLKSDIDFAYLIIKALININKNDIAFNIFNKIDQKFFNTHEYNELKRLIPVEQILPQLQASYSAILTFNPEKRFMVLPSSINAHNKDIGDFLLNEIKLALHKILKKVDFVQKISANNLSEDNISDLLELEINSRLSMLDYKLENQDRSGKSAKGSNAGEIDLELNINDFSIVIEAVKYSAGSFERKKHIEKTFKYDPSRKYIFNLVYFDKETKTFENAWSTLKNEIEQASYPIDFERENTTDLPSNNAGIKIAKSFHKNNLVYYHIMANFTYTEN